MSTTLEAFRHIAHQALNPTDKVRVTDNRIEPKTATWKGRVVSLLSTLNLTSLSCVKRHRINNANTIRVFQQAVYNSGYNYISNLSNTSPLTVRDIKLALSNLCDNMTQLPFVKKMTFSSLDANKSADFCINILGMEKMDIPDPALAKGRSWVKFPENGLEIHFVDSKNRYGYDEIQEFYKTADKLDQNMTVFTPFLDNHGAILVNDLTPYLNKLKANDIPYLGPVRRADGVYQLYIKIPGLTYLELDSKKASDKTFPTTTFDKVSFAPPSQRTLSTLGE